MEDNLLLPWVSEGRACRIELSYGTGTSFLFGVIVNYDENWIAIRLEEGKQILVNMRYVVNIVSGTYKNNG